MPRDLLAGLASEEVALAAIRAVVDGEITPIEGARRLTGHWVPVEAVAGTDDVGLRPTRGESLAALCEAAAALRNSGREHEARRLAELAWTLAERLENRDAMVQCAATLAQEMTSDPGATRKRLELLEFAVPEIVRSGRSAEIKAVMLANLADARFNETSHDHDRLQRTIAACVNALEQAAHLPEPWLCRTHLLAGTAYNELARDADDLRASIAHLYQALQVGAPQADCASILNNLGNSLRDLGIMTGDAETLEAALACFDEALPLRVDDLGRQRTVHNRRLAERALANLGATAPADEGNGVGADRELEGQLRLGDEAFHASQQDDGDADGHRKRAAARYVAAAALLRRDAPPTQRAEVMDRLGGLFLTWDDDDSLLTGLCFAAAARRLGSADWRSISLARVDSRMGEMLTIIGYLGNPAYLRRGQALLRDALPVIEAEGQPGESDRVRSLHTMSTAMLAGDV